MGEAFLEKEMAGYKRKELSKFMRIALNIHAYLVYILQSKDW